MRKNDFSTFWMGLVSDPSRCDLQCRDLLVASPRHARLPNAGGRATGTAAHEDPAPVPEELGLRH